MKEKTSEIIIFLILAGLVFGGFCLFDYWLNIDSFGGEGVKPEINLENNQKIEQLESEESLEEGVELPISLDLNVPFICQAPLSDWNPPFDHACEEAAVLMIHYYFQSKENVDPSEASEEIRKMVDFEKKTYDVYEDSSAEQVAQLVRDYYGYKARVKYNISLEDIKEEIAKGHPIIAPTAGRLLENPYFTSPGPFYHMLLVKGYDTDRFIVNDAGTRMGADYIYSYSILEKSIHDWNDGDVVNGKSAIIIIEK